MNLANNKIRAKSSYTGLFNWMESLVQIARTGSTSSAGTITVTPISQQWQQSGSGYTAGLFVTLSGMTGYKTSTNIY